MYFFSRTDIIRNNNKAIDLSRTFRQTGLVTGAKLELVVSSKTPTAVQVALQLPEGKRLSDKFASNTTIWKILRTFEAREDANHNFTARGVTELENGASGAGRIYYEMPSVNAMGRELSSFGDLQKTLAQLGFNGGTCLLRLSFKKTTQPLEEAMQEIGTYFKEEGALPSEPSKAPAEPQTVTQKTTEAQAEIQTSAPVLDSSTSEDVKMTSAPELSTPSATVTVGSSQRQVAVFSAPSADMPAAAQQPYNEQDYEPSIVHAKLHQARLLNNSHNQRLLSDAETEAIEKEKAEKLSTISQVNIKVRFPDQSSIVSTFTSKESALDLYKTVTDSIIAEDQPFKLVYTDKGAKTVPRDERKRLVRDLGFKGGVLVNFHWEDSVNEQVRKEATLKPHLRQNAQELKAPPAPVVEQQADTPASASGPVKSEETERKPKGMPKWLMKGLKK